MKKNKDWIEELFVKEFILNTQEIIDRIDEQESYFPIMSGAKKLLIAMLNIFEEQNNG